MEAENQSAALKESERRVILDLAKLVMKKDGGSNGASTSVSNASATNVAVAKLRLVLPLRTAAPIMTNVQQYHASSNRCPT